MQLGIKYLNSLTCEFYHFFQDKIWKPLTYNTPFYHSDLFWPTLYVSIFVPDYYHLFVTFVAK